DRLLMHAERERFRKAVTHGKTWTCTANVAPRLPGDPGHVGSARPSRSFTAASSFGVAATDQLSLSHLHAELLEQFGVATVSSCTPSANGSGRR
ncbi:hypothetical protein CTI14_55975, partial [Methylobacterium radiotolerans]